MEKTVAAIKPAWLIAITSQIRNAFQAIIGLIAIVVFFSIVSPSFRQFETYTAILEQSAVLAIMACGTTIVLISGGLDLSVGSVFALVMCTTGSLLILNLPVWLCIACGLLVGTACGMINGSLAVFTGIPPFIVTLGMMKIARGFAMMIGSGKDMSRFPAVFKFIGTGFFPVVIMALAFFIIYFLLSKTRTGFHAYAIGGNEEVSRLSGVKIKSNRIMFYGIGGFMAALAAIVQTSRFNFATPNEGQGWELEAIAAVVIGGTSLWGGTGGVGRTIIGVLVVKSLQAGLIHINVGSFMQNIAIGCVIILAVWSDTIQRSRTK